MIHPAWFLGTRVTERGQGPPVPLSFKTIMPEQNQFSFNGRDAPREEQPRVGAEKGI